MRSLRLLPLCLAALVVAAPAQAAGVMPADAATVLALDYVDETPRPFRLSAARPNPFSASTRLELTLDRTSALTVAVFDALGREVVRLHEGTLQAGTYALTLDGARLPTGLYLVRATDGRGVTATRSVALSR